MSSRDALVLVVLVLAAFALVEGIVLYNADPVAHTEVQVQTDVSTQTTVMNGTIVTTVTSPTTLISTSFQTVTTGTNYTQTSTSTLTTTAVSTLMSTSTATVTLTTTSTDAGAYVFLPPGAAANDNSTGFTPSSITVVLGVNNTVTWVNEDSTGHTVTSLSSSESFNSGVLGPGQSFAYTFNTVGTYSYIDALHPWETGNVTVMT